MSDPRERYDHNANNVTCCPVDEENDLVPIQLWREQEAEIERLRALLKPVLLDTDLQQPGSHLTTVNDYLALLSSYILDYMPDEAVPDDGYFGAWERAARPILQRLFDEIERLKAESQQLRERQETLELRNLPQWKPTVQVENKHE